mmetsp:Transcript_168130/g.540022  ORF Transcript_168130/g.540022 Transcript_168130/m.540022 type:complete len:222 (+) Transcript_168130:1070-1735(+)
MRWSSSHFCSACASASSAAALASHAAPAAARAASAEAASAHAHSSRARSSRALHRSSANRRSSLSCADRRCASASALARASARSADSRLRLGPACIITRYSTMAFLNGISGLKSRLSNGLPVTGFVRFPLENHAAIATRSKTKPSRVATGFSITLRESAQRKLHGISMFDATPMVRQVPMTPAAAVNGVCAEGEEEEEEAEPAVGSIASDQVAQTPLPSNP